MWQSQDLIFTADHPTAAGLFPSYPIIPGALLLDAVVAAVAGDTTVTVRAAKFLRPVRPGETLRLRWQSGAGGTVKFECRVGGDDLAMAGAIEVGLPP